MNGIITIMPIRQEKLYFKEHPVFGKEEALYGFIESVNGNDIILIGGDEIKVDDAHEFMVKLSNGSIVELHEDCIDEAIGNDWWDYYHDGQELEFEMEGEFAKVVTKPYSFKKTNRGFLISEFTDQYGIKCSIQKSSIATKDCIWLGVDNPNPQIMSRDAINLGLRESTNDDRDHGWIPFEIPNEVILSTRMHLSREDVKRMLPILQHFVETGSLNLK